MREIKFRAWDGEKMFEVSGIFKTREAKNQTCIQGYNEEHKGVGWYRDEDIELMQFTGLLDKNGKEIYEGDVLEAMGLLVPYKINVSFDVELGAYHLAREYSRAEVIGNIYENPELLK